MTTLSRRETLLAASALGTGLTLPALAATPFLAKGGFDAAAFKAWASARIGDGQPIWWYSSGSVRAYPSGDLLFFMEGFDRNFLVQIEIIYTIWDANQFILQFRINVQ